MELTLETLIAEGTKLGENMAGTAQVQAKAIELGIACANEAEPFWSAFHQARDIAYNTPRKRPTLTADERARARAIMADHEAEILRDLKWKYQTRNERMGLKPVPTSTLKKWASLGDKRRDFVLRSFLAKG